MDVFKLLNSWICFERAGDEDMEQSPRQIWTCFCFVQFNLARALLFVYLWLKHVFTQLEQHSITTHLLTPLEQNVSII